MSETLAIALVSAGSGLIGAIVGGLVTLATTYFGPKWERERLENAEFMERRRLAIVAWVRAGHLLATAVTRKDDDLAVKADAFNVAHSDLTSLIRADETHVDNFIHGAGSYSGTFKHNSGARRLIIGNAGRLLLAWHRGSIPADQLRPFKLVHDSGLNGSSIRHVDAWGSPTDGEVLDR